MKEFFLIFTTIIFHSKFYNYTIFHGVWLLQDHTLPLLHFDLCHPPSKGLNDGTVLLKALVAEVSYNGSNVLHWHQCLHLWGERQREREREREREERESPFINSIKIISNFSLKIFCLAATSTWFSFLPPSHQAIIFPHLVAWDPLSFSTRLLGRQCCKEHCTWHLP